MGSLGSLRSSLSQYRKRKRLSLDGTVGASNPIATDRGLEALSPAEPTCVAAELPRGTTCRSTLMHTSRIQGKWFPPMRFSLPIEPKWHAEPPTNSMRRRPAHSLAPSTAPRRSTMTSRAG